MALAPSPARSTRPDAAPNNLTTSLAACLNPKKHLAPDRSIHLPSTTCRYPRPGGPMFVCGGDFTPAPRDPCPNNLHDWPLPRGYVDAHEIAMKRLRKRWANKRCPNCGLYGWRLGDPLNDGTDVRVEIGHAS